MIGAIVGDIVGSKYEWVYFKSKDFELLDPDKCSFTDDSVMTIAVALALVDWKKNGGDLPTLAVKRLREFGRRYPYAGYGGRFDRWLFTADPIFAEQMNANPATICVLGNICCTSASTPMPF